MNNLLLVAVSCCCLLLFDPLLSCNGQNLRGDSHNKERYLSGEGCNDCDEYSDISTPEEPYTPGCFDSKFKVYIGGSRFRTCEEIAEDHPEKCDYDLGIKYHCRKTCKACGECFDRPGHDLSCAQYTKRGQCETKTEAQTYCRKSCNNCGDCQDSPHNFKNWNDEWEKCDSIDTSKCADPDYRYTCPETCNVCNTCVPPSESTSYFDDLPSSNNNLLSGSDACGDKPGGLLLSDECLNCDWIANSSGNLSFYCQFDKVVEHCPSVCNPGCQ